MDYCVLFGKNIKKVREYKKIAISKLALLSNYDRQALSRLENGKQNISLYKAILVVKALNVDFPSMFSENLILDNLDSFVEDDYFLIFTENIQWILNKNSKYQVSIYPETGLDSGYFSKILNHHIVPNLKTITKITNFLEIELQNLFTRGEK